MSAASLLAGCRLVADAAWSDLRYAARGLRRSPGLTASIIATLGLGIGANAAMFTVVDRVFFRSPPGVIRPTEVHRLLVHTRGAGGLEYTQDRFTTRDLDDFRASTSGVAAVEGYGAPQSSRIDSDPQTHTVAYATSGFFSMIGVRPAIGRLFNTDENRYGTPSNVAILNYDYWRSSFGGDVHVIGRTVHIDTTSFTIIGVMQPHFDGMDVDAVDVWAPLASMPTGSEGPWWDGDFDVVRLFARVSRGHDAHAIAGRLTVRYRGNREASPAPDTSAWIEPAPLLQARTSLGLGRDNQRNLAVATRLGGVSLVVLLVALCNVSSLLLMRALRRQREIGIRLALGMSRRRLTAQLLAESLLVAVVAGGCALWVAYTAGRVLREQLLRDVHWPGTVIDTRTVLFTAVIAVTISAAAGLAPLAVVRRSDIASSLKIGAAESGRPRSILSTALLVTQIALCTAMLSAAGSFLQSLRRANQFDLGFDADQLILFQLWTLDESRINDVVARIQALPEVAGVARTAGSPLTGQMDPIRLSNGSEIPALLAPAYSHVDTNFPRIVGMRVLRGRATGFVDQGDSIAGVLINATMANQFWPERDPIGDCFWQTLSQHGCLRVVGIVRDLPWDVARPGTAMYYPVATRLRPHWFNGIMVRTRDRATAAALRSIQKLLASTPTGALRPPKPYIMSEHYAPQIRPWRIAAELFVAFGLLALLAACVGIYGLTSYEVAQRTREFGVRITLGASAAAILGQVMRSGTRFMSLGLAIGLAASLAAARLISSLLFETSPYDPLVLIPAAIALGAAVLSAGLVPAWRATRVDPAIALRAE
jgi:putative ABC transport system permease protein